jgi:hypothetical protein
LFNDLLVLLAIQVILFEINQQLRKYGLRHLLSREKKGKQPRKPAVLRPKSERDCRFCQEDKKKRGMAAREMPGSWQLRKGKGGPKKKVATGGCFCPNESCVYYGISEEAIRDFKCQACGKKFTARRNTVMYQLKSHSAMMKKILLVLGSRVR